MTSLLNDFILKTGTLTQSDTSVKFLNFFSVQFIFAYFLPAIVFIIIAFLLKKKYNKTKNKKLIKELEDKLLTEYNTVYYW
jgi:predicted membrane protein